MRLNYPAEMPLDAVSILWDRVRGQAVPLGTLIHAAWAVAGYALGQLLPDGATGGISTGDWEKVMKSNPPNPDEIGPVLQGLFEDHTTAGPSTWMMLLRIALWVIANAR